VLAEATRDRHRIGQRRSADRSARWTPRTVVAPSPFVATAALDVTVVVAGAHRQPKQRAAEGEREEVQRREVEDELGVVHRSVLEAVRARI
jgi:hypothetical protein